MTYEQKLFNDLENLVKDDETFFSVDFQLDDRKYRIYNYRLASWTSFLKPGGKDARGIMFDITQEPKLVSAPPQKFFNYEEGSVNHCAGKFGDKMDKMDGSLISTYLHNGELYLKSKASLGSSQALASMKLLALPENEQFKAELTKLAQQNFTVNLEYTSPDNRIVIPYQTENLTVLSMRSHIDGTNYFASKLLKYLEAEGGYEAIFKHMVKFVSLHDEEIDQIKYMEGIRQETEGEGYVIEVLLNENESYLTKGKNLRYIALHHTKDSVNSKKRLFETVIMEASDDLRAMFADDAYVLKQIQDMEDHVQPIYNHLIKTVTDFHEGNKDLPKKEYALKGQKELPRELFGLAMSTYDGKTINYKEFAIKNRQNIFKVSDEELDDEGNVVMRASRVPKV